MTDVLITKYCGTLQSEDKKKKKIALEELSKFLHEHDSELEVTEKVNIYKHILRCFSDETEACRELAVKIVTDIIASLERKEDYFIYLMPALVQRLGGQEIVEPSEEVRLLKVSLLHCAVNKYHQTLLSSYLNDIIQILLNTLVDPYPKIKKESCECAADLAEAIPGHFYTHSQSLIVPILQSVTHQHYKVRIVAITAIGKFIRIKGRIFPVFAIYLKFKDAFEYLVWYNFCASQMCNKLCDISLQARLFSMATTSLWILLLAPLQSACLIRSKRYVRL
jgi:dynein assembly factor 5